jgi:hypothetical protein
VCYNIDDLPFKRGAFAVIDPSKHEDSSNFVESILRLVPGFRGYLAKEDRRESDHLARTWLADRLQAGKTRFDDYQRALLEAGQIDALPRCEQVRTRLDTLIAKIRGAMRGYSGFFDFVKINEETLDQVYRHDMSMVGDADSLARRIEELSVESGTPTQVIGDLLHRIDELDREFAKRGALLEGLDSKL